MATQPLFDIILFGYRNDLARVRTLQFLQALPSEETGPLKVESDPGVRHRLFAALDAEHAARLRATLESLGAQVAVLDASLETGAHSFVPEPPEGRQGWTRPLLELVLLLALCVVTYRWHQVQLPADVHLPPPPAMAAYAPPHEEPAAPAPSEAARLNAQAIRLAQDGNFIDAVSTMRRALRVSPTDTALTRNLQVMLLEWGTKDLAADRLDDASDHLEQARRLGDNADVLHAQGVTFLRQGRTQEAAQALDRALQLAPTDSNAMLMLANIYVHQDRRPEALELLERAKELGASGADLDRQLQRLGREVDTEWDFVSLESPHFRISFADDEDRRTVRLVLDTLEANRAAVEAKFDYHPSDRTPVVLYTQRDFHLVTQTPDWAGAVYDGRIKIPVRGLSEDEPGLTRVVRHEYAHSLITASCGGNCPVWLNEGLAVWAEEDRDGDHEDAAAQLLAGQPLFWLDELSKPFVSLPQQRASVAYAESYLAVRRLIARYGARKIPQLLSALSETPNVADAFANVYPGDFTSFQQNLLNQLRG